MFDENADRAMTPNAAMQRARRTLGRPLAMDHLPPLPILATVVGALILARASDDGLAAEVIRDTLATLEGSLHK